MADNTSHLPCTRRCWLAHTLAAALSCQSANMKGSWSDMQALTSQRSILVTEKHVFKGMVSCNDCYKESVFLCQHLLMKILIANFRLLGHKVNRDFVQPATMPWRSVAFLGLNLSRKELFTVFSEGRMYFSILVEKAAEAERREGGREGETIYGMLCKLYGPPFFSA